MAENMVKDLKKYADMDIDELLGKLSEEELEQLGNMVDPDVSVGLLYSSGHYTLCDWMS